MGKAAGRPLILQGSYPAGAPGGAWSKDSWWRNATGHEKGRSDQETRAVHTSWQRIETIGRFLLNL